jgi:hypothetical protein
MRRTDLGVTDAATTIRSVKLITINATVRSVKNVIRADLGKEPGLGRLSNSTRRAYTITAAVAKVARADASTNAPPGRIAKSIARDQRLAAKALSAKAL